jgi:hypothetical protein
MGGDRSGGFPCRIYGIGVIWFDMVNYGEPEILEQCEFRSVHVFSLV